MKKILLLTSTITLLATSGCLVSDGRRHESFRDEDRHEYVEHHEDVVVAPPAVDVRPPEVIVH
jgi:hypothetical protein